MISRKTIPTIKIDDEGMDELEPKEGNELDKARSDVVEKISVVGWKEALDERVPWIRFTFQISLLVMSGLCLYNSYLGIRRFLYVEYDDEINDIVDVESIPFSNVTVCAQVYFNETFVRENITIPDKVHMALKEENDDLEEFYSQLSLYLSLTLRPRKFSTRWQVLFSKVIADNPQIENFSTFIQAALPSCKDMLKKCTFGKQEFDCCQNAVQSFDDEGICYLVMLNLDSDNAFPKAKTKQQTNLGLTSGLTVEVSLSVKDSPWLDDDAQNGFRILVGPVPFTPMSSPVVAPHAAETFIKVKPERHGLISNCASHGNLNMDHSYSELGLPGGPFMYYDPEGLSCTLRDVMQQARNLMQCEVPLFLHRPNSTVICKPHETFILSSIMFSTELTEDFQASKFQGGSEKFSEFIRQMEMGARRTFSEKSRCPNHCQYWTYTSVTSFVDLERRNDTDEHIMYSKIHVYFADMGYREYEQVKELGGYLAFCEFGNVISLYWGMSIVSFFHVLYYLPRYAWVRMRMKRMKRKTAKIEPVRQIEMEPELNPMKRRIKSIRR